MRKCQGQNLYAQGQQSAALGNLANAAAGRGPSAAQAQLQQGTDAAIQSNMAMANSARGQAVSPTPKRSDDQNGVPDAASRESECATPAQEMQSAQSQYMGAANQMQNQYAGQQQALSGQNFQGYGMLQKQAIQQAQLAAAKCAQSTGSLAYSSSASTLR